MKHITTLHAEAAFAQCDVGAFARRIIKGKAKASLRAKAQAAFIAKFDITTAYHGPKGVLP
jgi:hypothetical protein